MATGKWDFLGASDEKWRLGIGNQEVTMERRVWYKRLVGTLGRVWKGQEDRDAIKGVETLIQVDAFVQ